MNAPAYRPMRYGITSVQVNTQDDGVQYVLADVPFALVFVGVIAMISPTVALVPLESPQLESSLTEQRHDLGLTEQRAVLRAAGRRRQHRGVLRQGAALLGLGRRGRTALRPSRLQCAGHRAGAAGRAATRPGCAAPPARPSCRPKA